MDIFLANPEKVIISHLIILWNIYKILIQLMLENRFYHFTKEMTKMGVLLWCGIIFSKTLSSYFSNLFARGVVWVDGLNVFVLKMNLKNEFIHINVEVKIFTVCIKL